MSKYIDAEKLIAEIERRLVKYDPDYTSAGSELKELLSFIASLQQEQPAPDLEAEIYKLYDGEYHDTEDVARHFYELGRNARKED